MEARKKNNRKKYGTTKMVKIYAKRNEAGKKAARWNLCRMKIECDRSLSTILFRMETAH